MNRSPRGVENRAELSPNGNPVIVAVREDGGIADEIEIWPDMEAWQAIATLRARLDVADPLPPARSLRLVSDRARPMSAPNLLDLCSIARRMQTRGY